MADKIHRTQKRINPGPKYHKIVDPDGKIAYVPKGTNHKDLPHTRWVFNEIVAQQICNLIMRGKTLQEIEATEGMPPENTIMHWARKHEAFRKEMQLAREDRAHHFHDEAITIARETEKRSQVPANKLKVETFKWAAERNAPKDYGNRTVHEGNPDRPITITVQTGIERPPIEVQGKVLDGKQDSLDGLPTAQTPETNSSSS